MMIKHYDDSGDIEGWVAVEHLIRLRVSEHSHRFKIYGDILGSSGMLPFILSLPISSKSDAVRIMNEIAGMINFDEAATNKLNYFMASANAH